MEQEWRKMEQSGGVWSNVGKSGAMWRSVGRYGEVLSNLEKSGAKWRSQSSAGKFGASPEQCGGVQGDMERSGDARSKCGERFYLQKIKLLLT